MVEIDIFNTNLEERSVFYRRISVGRQRAGYPQAESVVINEPVIWISFVTTYVNSKSDLFGFVLPRRDVTWRVAVCLAAVCQLRSCGMNRLQSAQG